MKGFERMGGGESNARAARSWGTTALLVAASVLVASAAQGHSDPVQIPPAGDYRVRWYQPHGSVPVEDWEIEVTPQLRPWARFTADAQVMPDASCWALNVPVNETANVRIRAVVGSQVSEWSRYTVVPEPGLGGGLAACAGLLAALARGRSRRMSPAAPAGLAGESLR